jgi:quercetin dioxygenase-like cupin family protein
MKSVLKLTVAVFFGVLLGSAMQALYAQQVGGAGRVLQRADLAGVPAKEVYMSIFEPQPGASFGPHIHYGDEFSYVIDGTVTLDVVGEAPRALKAGDIFHVDGGKVHGGKVTSATPAKILSVHIVDKGKPLIEPVK